MFRTKSAVMNSAAGKTRIHSVAAMGRLIWLLKCFVIQSTWPVNGELRRSLVPEDPLQAIQAPLHSLSLAIDFVGPSAKLLEGDRRRFVEVLPIEKDTANDRSKQSARTRVRRRCAVEKHLPKGTGTTFLPEHRRVRVDVAKRHALRWPRLAAKMRNRAHVRRPCRDRS